MSVVRRRAIGVSVDTNVAAPSESSWRTMLRLRWAFLDDQTPFIALAIASLNASIKALSFAASGSLSAFAA